MLSIALPLRFYWFLELFLVLCLASEFTLTLIFYFIFKRDVRQRQPLSQIRLSLSLSLGAGQIIFLAGINATENTVRGSPPLAEFIQIHHSWRKLEKDKLILWSLPLYYCRLFVSQWQLLCSISWWLLSVGCSSREFISTCLLWKFTTSTQRCKCITSCHGVFWFYSSTHHTLLGIILPPDCIIIINVKIS